jgi:branched-chain amino acid transport system permease protein
METLIAALGTGSIYALVALAYNIVYRTTAVFNLAQGAIVAIGSLVVFSTVGQWGWPGIAGLVACGAVGLVVTALEYEIAVRAVVKRGEASELWLVSTFGALVALQALAELVWGTQAHAVPIAGLDGLVDIGGDQVAVASLVAIVAAVVATVGLDLWYAKARPGKIMRAMSEDRQAAEARGINTARVALASFALAGVVAGATSFVLVPVTLAQADLGTQLAIYAFVAMAIGGFGSNRGALVGGIGIALLQGYGAVYVGQQYVDTMVFALLLATLLLFPRGIFGGPLGREV